MDGIIRGVSLSAGGKELLSGLRVRYPGRELIRKDSRGLPSYIGDFLKGLGSGTRGLKIKYDRSILTPFQKKVFRALVRVKAGSTISYSGLAKAVKTASSRAVGGALRSNPYPLIIPCHRVIKNDGSPGGYAGASRRMQLVKIKLLKQEAGAAKGKQKSR